MIRFVKRILCFFFKHKHKVTRQLSPTVYQVTCVRCGIMLACNDHWLPGLGMPWDRDFEALFNKYEKNEVN